MAVSVVQDGDIMARKKTDKLAEDVKKAIAAGMSYGKWKATQEPVKPEKTIPEGWKVCEYCGKPFKPVGGQKFCEIYCREQAYSKKASDIRAEYRKKWRAK